MADLSKCPIYTAHKPCGCCVAAAVANPEHAQDTAKTVAGWIKEGFTLGSTMDPAAIRWARLGGVCEHDKKEVENP